MTDESGQGAGGAPDPTGSLRAGDAERNATVARLQAAFSEGRLELVELDERTAAAYAAKTLGELRALTRDLPESDPATAGPGQVARRPGEAPVSRPAAAVSAVSGWLIGAMSGVVGINLIIWAAVSISSGRWVYPWWIWVLVFCVIGGAGDARQRSERRRRRRTTAGRREPAGRPSARAAVDGADRPCGGTAGGGAGGGVPRPLRAQRRDAGL